MLFVMSSATSIIIILLLYFLPATFPDSCPDSKFTCANLTLDIRYPFFTNNTALDCPGVYLIHCINLMPMIQFPGQEFMYPVLNISYPERTLIIHDLKLSLSPYPWGPDCVFLYNFKAPIPNVNVTKLSLDISSGQPLFDCRQKDYDSYNNIFDLYFHFSVCKDYDLYYTYTSDSQSNDGLPAYCSTSGLNWFGWKLSFSEDQIDGGGFSLLSAGFSHNWALELDCFNCRITCGDAKCSKEFRGGIFKNKKIIIGLTTGIGIFLLVCLLSLLYLRWHKRMYPTNLFWKKNSFGAQTIEAAIGKYESLAPKRYKYSDVKKITKSFHDKLGQGGYGIVFKGSLKDGRLVAVKVLNDSNENGAEFINEVSSIGWTSHVNVVSLLGICFEGSKRALIYEFMHNGSLEKYIYSEKAKSTLGWENLYRIAIGIARGLEYLHHGCNSRMVHFDIKPQNILLDNEFCPKISDFGLAKLCSPKDSKLSMPVPRGTIGYMAPEVFSRAFGVASSKSDVYSYGMVVLDMVGARNNKNTRVESTSETYFPDWIYSHIEHDGDLEAWGVTNETQEIAKKLIIVGLWCIQTSPRNRPSMSMVIEMLEGSISDLKVPPKEHLSSTLESLFGTSSTWVSEDASGCM